MAFAVPVLKKDYDLYSVRRRSAPASTLNKAATKLAERRRFVSATYSSSTPRPIVAASNDSVLSQSADRRHVRFGDCQEIRYRSEDDDDDEEEDDIAHDELRDDEPHEDDCDFAGSVDSGRSSLDSAEESDSKERIGEDPRRRAQQPVKVPTSILRRSNQDIMQSPHAKGAGVQDRPTSVRTVLQFLVAKCAPKN